MENEHQMELSSILGINKFSHEIRYTSKKTTPASWPEIYVEIGKLQERALYNQTNFQQRPGSDQEVSRKCFG